MRGQRSRHRLQMRDRQAGHEILRLHAQHPVRRHRQDQIDGLALRLVQRRRPGRGTSAGRARRCAPRAASSSSSPFHSASPIRVPSASRPTYQVKIDVASPRSAARPRPRPPADARPSARSPAPSACEPAPAGGEIERHVEQVAALPIVPALSSLSTSISAAAGMPSMETSGETGWALRAGDRLLVGGDQRAVVHGQALRPEEQLGRAQHVGVVAAVERRCAGSRARAD